MKNNVEKLNKLKIENEILYKELTPIIDNLYPKSTLGVRIFEDETYLEILKFEFGSIEYIKKLHELVEHYQRYKNLMGETAKGIEAIHKYKHYNSGVLLTKKEKGIILRYTYATWMLLWVSGELKHLLVMSN